MDKKKSQVVPEMKKEGLQELLDNMSEEGLKNTILGGKKHWITQDLDGIIETAQRTKNYLNMMYGGVQSGKLSKYELSKIYVALEQFQEEIGNLNANMQGASLDCDAELDGFFSKAINNKDIVSRLN